MHILTQGKDYIVPFDKHSAIIIKQPVIEADMCEIWLVDNRESYKCRINIGFRTGTFYEAGTCLGTYSNIREAKQEFIKLTRAIELGAHLHRMSSKINDSEDQPLML